jgi:hypothetical protein
VYEDLRTGVFTDSQVISLGIQVMLAKVSPQINVVMVNDIRDAVKAEPLDLLSLFQYAPASRLCRTWMALAR